MIKELVILALLPLVTSVDSQWRTYHCTNPILQLRSVAATVHHPPENQTDNPWSIQDFISSSGEVQHTCTTSSWKENATDEIPSVEMGFYGTAVVWYGTPRNQLSSSPRSSIVLSLNDTQYAIDVARMYEQSQARDDERVLLWSTDSLPAHQLHSVKVMLDPNQDHKVVSEFSFHSVDIEDETQMRSDMSSSYQAFSGIDFVNVEVYDTHPDVWYSPWSSVTNRHYYIPWSTRTWTDKYGHPQSFHHSSSWGNEGNDVRTVAFEIAATSVSVYGIPRALLEHPAGPQEICFSDSSYNNFCRYIDGHHIYSNMWDDWDPVLLHYQDSLDPYKITRVTLRLLQPHSNRQDEIKTFSFFKAEWQALKASFTSDFPQVAVLRNEVLTHDHSKVQFLPSSICTYMPDPGNCRGKWFNAWEAVPALEDGSTASFRRTSSWMNEEIHRRTVKLDLPKNVMSVRILGGPPSWQKHPPGVHQICIQDAYSSTPNCVHIDASHQYLAASQQSLDTVLLWDSSSDSRISFHPSGRYTFTMKLTTNSEPRQDYEMSFARAEVSWMDIPSAPDAAHCYADCPFIGQTGLLIMGAVILLCLWGCFVCALTTSVQERPRYEDSRNGAVVHNRYRCNRQHHLAPAPAIAVAIAIAIAPATPAPPYHPRPPQHHPRPPGETTPLLRSSSPPPPYSAIG